jgi:hypothetical protein
VSASKYDIGISLLRLSTRSRYGLMSSYAATNCSGRSGAPSRLIRSVIDSTCGLVKRPVRNPNSDRIASIIRAVDVLPLVPVTWMTGYARCGWPSRSTKALIRSRDGSSFDSGQRLVKAISTCASSVAAVPPSITTSQEPTPPPRSPGDGHDSMAAELPG